MATGAAQEGDLPPVVDPAPVEGHGGQLAAAGGQAVAHRPKTSLSSIKLEKFNGERKYIDQYKEWKKSVRAHIMLFQLDEAEASLLLYLAVGGEAKQVLDVLELQQMTSAGGLTKMWTLLDESYLQTAPDRYERARIQYERCARRPGETMDQYISNLRRCKLMWQQEDHGCTISDRAYSHKLLSGSSLRLKEQREIHYLSGELSSIGKVEELLRVLHPHVADVDRKIGRVAGGRTSTTTRTAAVVPPPPQPSYKRSFSSQKGQLSTGTKKSFSTGRKPHGVHVAEVE
eukprot:6472462-Amphidinium_carterae.1